MTTTQATAHFLTFDEDGARFLPLSPTTVEVRRWACELQTTTVMSTEDARALYRDMAAKGYFTATTRKVQAPVR